MNILSYFFATFALFFIINSGFAQNAYYPLKTGKYWVYQYSDDFVSTSGSKSKIEILEKTENIGGKIYFVLQTSIGDDSQYDVLQKSYLRNGANGKVFGLANTDMAEEQILIAEGPLKVGQSWTAEADGQKSTSIVVGLNESLTTPLNTHNKCLVIETEMGDAKIRSYFQKDIGLVASSLILPDGEKLMQYLLK